MQPNFLMGPLSAQPEKLNFVSLVCVIYSLFQSQNEHLEISYLLIFEKKKLIEKLGRWGGGGGGGKKHEIYVATVELET